MEKKFEFFVDRDRSQFAMNVYLTMHDGNRRSFYQITETGDILATVAEHENFISNNVKPFFRFPFEPTFPHKAMLQAIAEGLKEYGIVAEVDNAQRIVAQALADERGKTIEYFKAVNDKLVEKIVR